MDYMGAVDYWFWKGIGVAYNTTITNPEEYLVGMLVMNNKTNHEAADAFKWGFYLGKELSQDDYDGLTNAFKKEIVELQKVIAKAIINVKVPKIKYDGNVKGNC